MSVNFIQRAKIQKRRPRIVLPEGLDARILEATREAIGYDIAVIILLGNKKAISTQIGTLADNVEIVDPEDNPRSDEYAHSLFELRAAKGLSLQQAQTLVRDPIYCAQCLIRAGHADACIAGAVTASAKVVRAALQTIGTEGNARVSSFFILQGGQFKHPVIFADCAINIEPNAEQLADIAAQSADSARKLLGIEPNVAMLSFSTNGSAAHPLADKLRDASQILKQRQPSLSVLGEIQFDAAIDATVRNTKWPSAPNTRAANVFIFPSLEAGNIGYKIAERLGGATAIGPILQGLKQPVNDLSRGATVSAILNTLAVTALQV